MDHKEFDAVVERQVKQMRAVLLTKADEYATDDDRLHNFKLAAALAQNTPMQALWGMQVKHLVSISDMVKSGKSYPSAVWDEKIGDAINYFVLLRAQAFEEETQSQAT